MAKAIASRYGLPFEAIATRMRTGRFRVKSNVDAETAQRVVADLESMGAVCSVVDTTGAAATKPPVRTGLAAARPGSASSRSEASSALAAAGLTSAPQPVADAEPRSGLAAAYGDGSAPAQEIGALGDESGSFSLSALDGSDDQLPAPPAVTAPATAGGAENDMVDLFAPPDAQNEELVLAVDVGSRQTPPPMDAESTPSRPSFSPAPELVLPRERHTPAQMLARDDRLRLVVGALLALLLGFLPAHVISSIRESSRYDEIAADVKAEYTEWAKSGSPDDWRALDDMLADQRALAESVRNNIAVTGVVIWLGLAGLLGFVWLRKLPWERWE